MFQEKIVVTKTMGETTKEIYAPSKANIDDEE
jgi:hypothetical protein